MAHKEQQKFCEEVKKKLPDHFNNKKVIDMGSLNINGDNQYLFENCKYVGVDLIPGKNVDVICHAHRFPLPDDSANLYDVVISTEMLEHDKHYKESLKNMYNLLKPGGLMLFTCATTGRKEHGTKNKSPKDSPATPDYYKNLTAWDICEGIDIENKFKESQFSVKGTDLRFWGVKK